jgi:hypothetical protein
MKRFLYPVLAIALLPQSPASAQPQPVSGYRGPFLSNAIANGSPFLVQLRPGANNGTLLGGETYVGQYNHLTGMFTVSGNGLRDDGVVIQLTSTDGGADPLSQQLSLWGATYTFDSQGNVSLFGRRVGRLWLQK